MSLDLVRERALAKEPAPTHPQAALFRALHEHLARFPQLPEVNVNHGGELQITANGGVAPAELVAWAKTITVGRVQIKQHGDDPSTATVIEVHGSIAGVPVRVWTVDRGDLHRMLPAAEKYYDRCTDIPLADLAAYVALGSVDGVIAGVAR